MALTDAAIATNRFGLGARPDEAPPANPRRWLISQFERYEARPAVLASQPGTPELIGDLAAYRAVVQPMRRQQKEGGAEAAGQARQMAQKAFAAEARDDYQAGVSARLAAALTSEAPFVERMVHFWSNHFAISADKQQTRALGLAYEVEAIRPHVLGRFSDMLLAVERHAAMQLYLDQTRSVGPNSPLAQRASRRDRDLGLNENLAREILELHTLGVRTGYTQADVTEFARALTGWSVGGLGPRADGAPGAFVFRAQAHEPGTRTVLGRTYSQAGEAQARAVLADLATHPSTAHHIATKLARHVVADEPPPALVERLAQTYLKSGGDLPSLYRTLIDAPEAWRPTPAKFKTPWEWLTSSLRGIGLRDAGRLQAAQLLTQLGQATWRPGSPAGFDDVAASWAAPEALVRRVELSQRLAALVGDRLDARALAEKLAPGGLSSISEAEISRAESPRAALALLLVSPEFLRR